MIDLMMPNLNGLEVLRQVKKLSPATCSIVLSMQSSNLYVVEAFKAGAAGYILKDTAPGEVVAAIHSVMQGQRYLSDALSERLETNRPRVEDAPSDLYPTLTRREREILQMAAEGKSSNQIGDKLMISPLYRGNTSEQANEKTGVAKSSRADPVRDQARNFPWTTRFLSGIASSDNRAPIPVFHHLRISLEGCFISPSISANSPIENIRRSTYGLKEDGDA